MVMSIKEIFGTKPKPVGAPFRPQIVVRLTNPRSKAVVEFGVPITAEGFVDEACDEVYQRCASQFEQWGLLSHVEPGEPDQPEVSE